MLYQLSYTPKSVAPSENQVGDYLLSFSLHCKGKDKNMTKNQQVAAGSVQTVHMRSKGLCGISGPSTPELRINA